MSMNKCPFCGHDEYFVVCRMSGIGEYHYRYDGRDACNSTMHDCLGYTENKTMYCSQCRKKIGIKTKGK